MQIVQIAQHMQVGIRQFLLETLYISNMKPWGTQHFLVHNRTLWVGKQTTMWTMLAHPPCTHVMFWIFLFGLNCLFGENCGCYLISACSTMSFEFVQLMLDNTDRDIKPQFECDLFCCFYLKGFGERRSLFGRISSCLCSVGIHKLAFVPA